MKVNAAKTNLLVVSASKPYEARGHIIDQDNHRVDCTNMLKALGFTFNTRGDVSSQINVLCKKFRQKVWALRHLRKSGFKEQELIKVYTSYMRPTVEYSAPIYHSMLSGEQTLQLKRLQYFALKNIFGFEYSHRKFLELADLPTLEERRKSMTEKFARKTADNPQFNKWFPTTRVGIRRKNRTEYKELQARMNRRQNSPLYYYWRILNKHRVNYDVRTSMK